MKTYKSRISFGFTIVELIVVIVVIGILAAITIVAYTGINQKAIVASLQSDLENAYKQMELLKVDNDGYPTNITPTTFKSSNGNTYVIKKDTFTAFCFELTNTNTTKYYITNGGVPTQGSCPTVNDGIVTTLIGGTGVAFADGNGTTARVYHPAGLAVDSSGNLYVADTYNHRIRKITPASDVTTVAGSGTATFADGTGAAASFCFPEGVAVDSSGNLYVADAYNHLIRKITPAGVVTTLAGSSSSGYADGTGVAASFNQPHGVATDSFGNIYIGDYYNHRIRQVSPAGVVTTLAGNVTGIGNGAFADGTGAAASFNSPFGVAVDSSGNVYVADYGNNRIRKIH